MRDYLHSLMDMLLKYDLLNVQDESGLTLLMKTCQNKNELDVLFLKKQGAEFFFENDKGDSAYKILKRKRSLPQKLQSLKENFVLSQMNSSKNSDSPGL